MYALMLIAHSLLRWIVLIQGVAATLRGCAGWLGGSPWRDADDRAGLLLVISLDLQLLVGLSLYLFLSPVTVEAFRDMALAMRTPALRYWTVEHITTMLLAAALVHVGRVRVRRANESPAKHRRAALFFALAVAAMVFATPWPMWPNGRPWLRLG